MSDEEYEYTECRETNEEGEPCGAPPHLIIQEGEEAGLCQAHASGGSEKMAEMGRRGGKKSPLEEIKGRISDTLDPDELPDLETHRDAEVWLEVIGRGVLCGKVEERRAQAGIRAVQSWLDARGERLTAERLEELEAKLEAVTAELERDAGEPWA